MSARASLFLGRCRLGRHDFRYVGFVWIQDNPWTKSGHDHVCSRCGKEAYYGLSGNPCLIAESQW